MAEAMNILALRLTIYKLSIFLLLVTVLILVGCDSSSDNEMVVNNLYCEYQINPLGIDESQPRMSWILTADQRGEKQSAYRVLVASSQEKLAQDIGDLWDSGKIDSDQSIHVVYAGKELQSRMKCFWKIRAWNRVGKPSKWSQMSIWTMGLLKPDDWQAKWICADHNEPWQQGNDWPLPWLRKTFVLRGCPQSAMVYVTALGYYELYVNGKKVNDYVLTPAVSDYSKRALYLTHDITDYLIEGENCIALWLGRGWNSALLDGELYNNPPTRAQIDVTFADEKMVQIVTDKSWKFHYSPITPLDRGRGGHYGGERYDARMQLLNWNTAVLDDTDWRPVKETNVPTPLIVAQSVQPNRLRETIKPISVEKLDDRAYLIDMGRHFTGWFRFKMHNSSLGNKVTFEYIDQIRSKSQFVNYNQCDEYICSGEKNEEFCCRFNYHAFRWVKVAGLDYEPRIEDIKGYLVHTDYAQSAQFECSNDLFNQIYNTTLWTYRCLSLGGYVVDCPHRERMGYGGDAGTSMQTAMTNFNVAALYTKWIADWHDTQDAETGNLPHIAPFPYAAGGGPAWSGICVTLPWQIYRHYGDKRILEISYPMIQKWLEFMEKKTTDGILEPYIAMGENNMNWSFLGDWVPPGRGQGLDQRVDDYSILFFNNCYRLYNTQLAGRIARVLEKEQDAVLYEKKAETLKNVIHRLFFNANKNTYVNGEQPYLAMPLLFGITPDVLKDKVMANLENDIIIKQNGHLNTGMHGTYFMLDYLTQSDRNDLIFKITNQKTYPGWGYMIENGATTIWEEWNGNNSQIHNTSISIGAWFIQGLGGIRVDENAPGYKHVFIKPAFVGNLTFARTQFDSMYGTIITDWQLKDNHIILKITVPANTTATLYLPTTNIDAITESGRPTNKSPEVKFLRTENNNAVYQIGSGDYNFACLLFKDR